MPGLNVNNGRSGEQQSHPFKTVWMDAAGRGGIPRPVIKTTTAAELLKTSMPDVREELNVLIEVRYSSLNFKDGENCMASSNDRTWFPFEFPILPLAIMRGIY